MSGEIQYKFSLMSDWRDLTRDGGETVVTGLFTNGQDEIRFRMKPPFTPGFFVHKDWVQGDEIEATTQLPLTWFEREHPGPNYRRVEVKIVDQ